jgi:hypothetical protein
MNGYQFAINSRTFELWSEWLERALDQAPPDGVARIEALVRAYFGFAEANFHAWMAIYDHRIDRSAEIDRKDEAAREALTGIVDREVAAWLGRSDAQETRRLVRSLIATVHGHCALWLLGSYALMREEDPAGQAVARVVEILAAQGEGCPVLLLS